MVMSYTKKEEPIRSLAILKCPSNGSLLALALSLKILLINKILTNTKTSKLLSWRLALHI